MLGLIVTGCGCETSKINLSNRIGVDFLYNDLNFISTNRTTKNVASCKGKVHVAWFARDNYGNVAIFYKRSPNGGTVWDPSVQLTPFTSMGLELWVQCYGDTVVIAYERVQSDYELYYMYSLNGGVTWSSSLPLETGSYNQESPGIWLWNNMFHLVWSDNRPVFLISNYNIYYKRSSDMGSTWTPDDRQDLSDSPIIVGDPTNPQNLHILFMTFNLTERRAKYRGSSNGGSTWTSTFDLSGGVNASGSGFWGRPIGYITVYNSNVHAVFIDDRYGNKEVIYRRSNNSGITWSSITRLTNTPGLSWSPFILMNPFNEVRLYWTDNSDGDFEIMCKISTNNGLTWTPEANLTNNTAKDVMVSVDYDITTSRWNIVWTSDRSGDWEVYYTMDPCPLGNDEELSIYETVKSGWEDFVVKGRDVVFMKGGSVKVYTYMGRITFQGSVSKGYKLTLGKGVWFLIFDGKVHRIVIH